MLRKCLNINQPIFQKEGWNYVSVYLYNLTDIRIEFTRQRCEEACSYLAELRLWP